MYFWGELSWRHHLENILHAAEISFSPTKRLHLLYSCSVLLSSFLLHLATAGCRSRFWFFSHIISQPWKSFWLINSSTYIDPKITSQILFFASLPLVPVVLVSPVAPFVTDFQYFYIFFILVGAMIARF